MGKFFKKLFGRPSKGMEPLRQQKDLPSVTPSDCVEISYRHIDTDEGVPTPKGTVLSYLDAGALKFWNGKTTDYEIPEYYRTTAFVRNVLPAKDRLLAQGFLEVGDLRTNISLKTVPDLKAILAEKELKTTGKKAELVQRLLDYISEEELEELFPVGKYRITETGLKAAEPYSIIQENNNHALHFSYYRLLEEKAKTPGNSDNAIITRIFSQDIQECYRTGNISTYQRLISDCGRFMLETGEPERAVECYILAYFVWIKDTERLGRSITGPEGYYIAQNIESAGKQAGYSLNGLLEMFQRIAVEYHPFGIGSKKDVQKAVNAFRTALKI